MINPLHVHYAPRFASEMVQMRAAQRCGIGVLSNKKPRAAAAVTLLYLTRTSFAPYKPHALFLP